MERRGGGGRRYMTFFVFFQLCQVLRVTQAIEIPHTKGLLGALDMQVMPKYIVVNPGEHVKFMCKLNGKLDSCSFKVAGIGYSMKPGKEKDGIQYLGEGLDKGECGVFIQKIEEKHNGNVTCTMALDTTDPTEHLGHMQLVVATAPQKPELEVSVGTEGTANVYRERDLLTAVCTIRDGRPAANITWFMGEDVITEGLRIPVETCTPQNKELCTIQQNLTRTLQAADDKKALKCVSRHHAFKGGEIVAEYKINVNYPPKPSHLPFERFGLVEGVTGRVPITVEANPKPLISWSVGGDTIYENTNHGRYTVIPTVLKGPGKYETVLLIDTLTKEDTDKEYRVTAHNELGEEQYFVSISTSPEPKVLELGAGLIIIIVAGIVVVLLILAGVLYARAKGKLCFAVGDAEKRVASPSEGTENPAVNHHASSEYINNSPELKKEKPKEDTPV